MSCLLFLELNFVESRNRGNWRRQFRDPKRLTCTTQTRRMLINASQMITKRILMLKQTAWFGRGSHHCDHLARTDRILLDNGKFDWFYDILVKSSYFHLIPCRYVAMNVKNITYQASFRRTCPKINPRANIILVSHLAGWWLYWVCHHLQVQTNFVMRLMMLVEEKWINEGDRNEGKRGFGSQDLLD